MRRKTFLGALVLLVASTVLGATVFREQVAAAAQNIMPVKEQNLDANGNIRVHEQGTARVEGTVGLSTDANTVKIDPAANSVQVNAGADYAARNAYSTTASGFISGGQLCGNNEAFTIPSGKRFVIEWVSGEYSSTFESGHKAQFFVQTNAGGREFRSNFVATDFPRQIAADSEGVFAEQTRLYADAGGFNRVGVCRDGRHAGSGHATTWLSGYLVDLP